MRGRAPMHNEGVFSHIVQDNDESGCRVEIVELKRVRRLVEQQDLPSQILGEKVAKCRRFLLRGGVGGGSDRREEEKQQPLLHLAGPQSTVHSVSERIRYKHGPALRLGGALRKQRFLVQDSGGNDNAITDHQKNGRYNQRKDSFD